MKLSIKTVLICGIVGLLLISITTILASSYLTSENVLHNHARDIMENISNLTIQQSQSYLEPAQDAVKLTERLANSKVVSSEDRILLERYFLEQLSLHSQIAGIYFGTPLGEFIYVMKSDEKTERGFKSKFISIDQDKRNVEIIWRDSTQKELFRETDPDDAYDPRKRPWYIKADSSKKLIWTDPYIFFTSKKPGITTASPVYTVTGDVKGIIGVDIEIDDISVFLSKLKVGKHGLAFIMGQNGDVIAFPDQSKISHPVDRDSAEIRLVKIHELDDPLSRKAYGAIKHQNEDLDFGGPVFSTFHHEDKDYHVMFSPFTDKQWPWIIGTYLPEDDYLGPIKRNRMFNIIIGLVIALISSVIGLIISRSISKPMIALQSEAMAIKGYDLDTTFEKRSIIKEVQMTADAFSQMKSGLEKYKNENEKFTEDLEQQADELKKNDLQLQATFKSLVNFTDALIVLDREHKIRFMNPAAETLMSISNLKSHGRQFAYPVTENKASELVLKARDGRDIIVEMLVIDTEWEGQDAFLVSLRDITERKHAEQSLNDSNEKLQKMVSRLRRREGQLTSIGKMSEFFQVCTTEKEILKIVSENMPALFPVNAGVVYIAKGSSDILSKVFSWGDKALSRDSFPAEECWALKKGKPHSLSADKSKLYCDHISNGGDLKSHYICIPIATSKTRLGLLYFQFINEEQQAEGVESLLELGRTVAEHIALAVSNVRMQERLQIMAIQDPLTGLYNRRYMQEFLEHEIFRAARDKKPIGIILLDIDHFKSINDQCGHHAGDHALKTMADLIKSNIRKGDICCRYGGEEFLLILPGSYYSDTSAFAEKLRLQVKQLNMSYDGRKIDSFTISLGVAAYPDQATTYEELVKLADDALYRAKENGRDRVS